MYQENEEAQIYQHPTLGTGWNSVTKLELYWQAVWVKVSLDGHGQVGRGGKGFRALAAPGSKQTTDRYAEW